MPGSRRPRDYPPPGSADGRRTPIGPSEPFPGAPDEGEEWLEAPRSGPLGPQPGEGQDGDGGREPRTGDETHRGDAEDDVAGHDYRMAYGLHPAERAPRLRHQGDHRGKGPRGYARPDSRIRDEICDRLTDHPSVDASDLEVEVSGGEVTLSGTVLDRHEKWVAEECADEGRGVSHVHNALRVWNRAARTSHR